MDIDEEAPNEHGADENAAQADDGSDIEDSYQPRLHLSEADAKDHHINHPFIINLADKVNEAKPRVANGNATLCTLSNYTAPISALLEARSDLLKKATTERKCPTKPELVRQYKAATKTLEELRQVPSSQEQRKQLTEIFHWINQRFVFTNPGPDPSQNIVEAGPTSDDICKKIQDLEVLQRQEATQQQQRMNSGELAGKVQELREWFHCYIKSKDLLATLDVIATKLCDAASHISKFAESASSAKNKVKARTLYYSMIKGTKITPEVTCPKCENTCDDDDDDRLAEDPDIDHRCRHCCILEKIRDIPHLEFMERIKPLFNEFGSPVSNFDKIVAKTFVK